MSGLFGKTRTVEPEPPAEMPDPYDTLSNRDEKRRLKRSSSTTQNNLAPVPGTIGREYSRSTLG